MAARMAAMVMAPAEGRESGVYGSSLRIPSLSRSVRSRITRSVRTKAETGYTRESVRRTTGSTMAETRGARLVPLYR